jgi:hypothetical protein
MTGPRSAGVARTFAVTGCSIALGLAGLVAASSAVGAAGHQPACAQAKHTFISAVTATVSAKKIVVHGHPATFHCGGPDDGSYRTKKATETITVLRSATITVFKQPENPSVTWKVSASALPHWVKHNRSEPIYRIAGPKAAITAMTEQFHP